MDVCDIVLGRPWIFNVGAVRSSHENSTYEFLWAKTRVILVPSPKPTEEAKPIEDENICQTVEERSWAKQLTGVKDATGDTLLYRDASGDFKFVPNSQEVTLSDHGGLFVTAVKSMKMNVALSFPCSYEDPFAIYYEVLSHLSPYEDPFCMCCTTTLQGFREDLDWKFSWELLYRGHGSKKQLLSTLCMHMKILI